MSRPITPLTQSDEDAPSLLPRVLAALNKQVFAWEPGFPEDLQNPRSIGARIGGELRGDWDSALQAIPELLLYDEHTAPVDQEQLKLLLDDVHRTIQGARLRITGDVAVTQGDLQRATETLRLNYLALIVLVRRAHRSPALQPLARHFVKALFPEIERRPPMLSLDAQDLAGALPTFEEAMSRAISGSTDGIRGTREVAARDRKHPDQPPRAPAARVRQSLRAFLCLAVLPPLPEAPKFANTEGARLVARLVEQAGDLYRLASGVDPEDDLSCGWPPPRLFRGANALTQTMYFVSGLLLGERHSTLESLELRDQTLETWLPSGSQAKGLLKSLGSVPQAKDLLGALGLLAIPQRNQGTKKAETWLDFLHEARGPFGETTGLYCYLPVTSGVATAAIRRYLKATAKEPVAEPTKDEQAELQARAALRHSADQSLGAMRALRFGSDKQLRGLPFAQFCMYNEMYLRSILLTLELPEAERERFAGLLTKQLDSQDNALYESIRYILSCRSTNGLFQQRYRSNELDEGELFAAGQCIRTLALLSQKLTEHAGLGATISRAIYESRQRTYDEASLEKLQRTISEAVTTSAMALVENQNASGGFATFERTDREKRGLLGSNEGPGAQEMFFFDAAAADTTGWVLEGLCHVANSEGIYLPPSERRSINAAIDAGIGWLRRDFDPRAGWWARYGGGYVVGTACALRAFAAAQISPGDPVFAQGLQLLRRGQNSDGGWGQSPDADDSAHNDDPSSVAMRGPSDPELTAFALMALLEAGIDPDDPNIIKARNYLLLPGPDAGGWTATGPQHSFMQGWIYTDQAHLDLRPTQALLTWQLAAAKQSKA